MVALVRMFCMRSLLYKYLYYSIIRHFAPVIQEDCNKPCWLAYKVYYKKLLIETNNQKRRYTRELKFGQINNLIQMDEFF